MKARERTARAKRRGVWSEDKGRFKPPPYFIASARDKRYHAPNCPEVGRIREEDRFRIRAEEAIDLGLSPHAACLGESR